VSDRHTAPNLISSKQHIPTPAAELPQAQRQQSSSATGAKSSSRQPAIRQRSPPKADDCSDKPRRHKRSQRHLQSSVNKPPPTLPTPAARHTPKSAGGRITSQPSALPTPAAGHTPKSAGSRNQLSTQWTANSRRLAHAKVSRGPQSAHTQWESDPSSEIHPSAAAKATGRTSPAGV
jgi:hypothetical protein